MKLGWPHLCSTMAAVSNAFALLDVGDEEHGQRPKQPAAARKAKAGLAEDAEPATLLEETGARDELVDPLVWIDCEMTGLEVETCALIEIAVLVTDGQLRTVVEGPDLVIAQSEEVLAGMNAWCVEHHGKSGLTERVRASTVSLAEAEEQCLAFVSRFCAHGTAQLAGNSVHVDLSFLKRYMPRLAAHLSYRVVDVSSISALGWRWYPSTMRRQPRKECAHTAKADILESLNGAWMWSGVGALESADSHPPFRTQISAQAHLQARRWEVTLPRW